MSERIAKKLHDAYERHAMNNGWETQVASRKRWDEVPEANRNTMLAMVAEVLPDILEAAFLAGTDHEWAQYNDNIDASNYPAFEEWYREEYGNESPEI